MPDNEIRDVVVYSEEMQDVVGEVPLWIIRSGISVLFIVIISFLIGSWFFKYPDIMIASIKITTKNPPVFLVANSSGKLEKLFVKDKQIVTEDEIIAMIENNTNYESILDLKTTLDQLSDTFEESDVTDFAISEKIPEIISRETKISPEKKKVEKKV